MELRIRDGRAVFVDREGDGDRDISPETLPLPSGLARDLQEWARVAAAVLRTERAGDEDAAGQLVSRRGRQLAGRVATVFGVGVAYADPVRGETELVEARPAPAPVPRPAPRPEPTPWATGLIVAAFTAVIVVFAIVTLSYGLGETSPLLAVVANLLVVGGLSPSVWLARKTPTWRWVAFGVVIGVGTAWFVLLLSLL